MLGLGLFLRASGSPTAGEPEPEPFVFDTFTFGPAGTALETHTADSGATIAKHPASANTMVSDGLGMVRGHTVNSVDMLRYATDPVANVRITADLFAASDNNSSSLGVCARIHATDNTCYMFRLNASGDLWQLYKIITGTATLLGSAAQVITPGATYAIDFTVDVDHLDCLVNGDSVVSVTNADITAAGYVGIRTGGASGNTVGLHLDNFRAFAVEAA